MIRRLIGIFIVTFSILFLPYWVYLPILLIAILFISFFWEGMVFAFLISIIHGIETTVFSLLTSPFTLIIFLLLILSLPIQNSIRSYV